MWKGRGRKEKERTHGWDAARSVARKWYVIRSVLSLKKKNIKKKNGLEICADRFPCKQTLSFRRLDIRDRKKGVWCLFLLNAAVLPSFPKAPVYCQTFMWDRVTRGSFHSSLPGDIRHPPAVCLSLRLPTTHPPSGKHCTSLFSHLPL